MSQAKRDQLIAEGKLAEDGSRVPRCPTCGQELPEGVELEGAVVETVEAEVGQ